MFKSVVEFFIRGFVFDFEFKSMVFLGEILWIYRFDCILILCVKECFIFL